MGWFLSLPEEQLFLHTIAIVGALLSVLTGVSITALLSLRSEIADALRSKGFYKDLMKYAHRSVLLSLLMTSVAVLGFFISARYAIFYQMIFFGVLLSAAGAFYRVFWLLIKIGGFYKEGTNQ